MNYNPIDPKSMLMNSMILWKAFLSFHVKVEQSTLTNYYASKVTKNQEELKEHVDVPVVMILVKSVFVFHSLERASFLEYFLKSINYQISHIVKH